MKQKLTKAEIEEIITKADETLEALEKLAVLLQPTIDKMWAYRDEIKATTEEYLESVVTKES